VSKLKGWEQITKALTQMETITQQNAVNAEEGASIAGKLNAQAESMRKVVQGTFGM
jgi:methyl-accepting chemotaxis protein